MNSIISTFINRHISFKLHWFLAGLVCMSVVGWYFNTIPPERGREVIILGIGIISSTCWILLFSFTNNVRRVSIITLGIVCLLLLRVFKLYDILYYLTLFAFLITLDIALRKRHE